MTTLGYVILPIFFILAYFPIVKGIKINLTKFLGYSLVLSLTIQLIFNKIIPSLTVVAGTTVLLMLIISSALKLMKNPSKIFRSKYLLYVTVFFALIGCYFLITSFVSPASYFGYTYEFRVLFIVYLYTALFLTFSKEEILDGNFLFKILIWMFVFQVVIGVFQFLSLDISNAFKFNEWVHNGEIQGRIGDRARDKVLLGTFGHMHSYSAYLAMMTIFLFGAIKSQIVEASWRYHLLISISILLILLTGVRTPVLSLIVSFLVFYYLTEKNKFLLVLIILVLLLPLVAEFIISASGGKTENEFDSPFMRVAMLFTLFEHGLRSGDYIFITRGVNTVNLILNSFIQSPLFGVSEGYILGYNFKSPTDYYLFLTIIEFGIIGFLLLISPFIFVFKKLVSNKRLLYIALSVFSSLMVSSLAHHTYNNMPHLILFTTIICYLIHIKNFKSNY